MTTESIGPYLREARERQGLSLDEMAARTRIQRKFLGALEDEDFGVLPGQVFARGFVKTYARSLGIDEEEVVRRFSEDSSHFYQRGQEELDFTRRKHEEENQGKFNRNLVIVITGVILIGLAFLLPEYQQAPPSPNSNTSSEQTEVSAPPEISELDSEEEVATQNRPEALPPQNDDALTTSQGVSSIESVPQQQQPTTESAIPAETTNNSEKPLNLEIEATQLTWVVVRSDDKDPHEALLQPGQRVTWEATDHFTLTLGNAGGVVVKLDGETQGPFGKPGAVVRDIVISR